LTRIKAGGRAGRSIAAMTEAPTLAAPIAAWHTEHVCFKQLLYLMQREVDVFHTGERPNYELMYDIVSYLRDYGDLFHHPREDVAFARLAKHCPDMKLALARLGHEHRVIAHAGETLQRQIEAILGGAMVQRAEVEIVAATYLVYYGSHIAKEEEDILTRAALHLTKEDWKAVKDAAPGGPDALLRAVPPKRFQELFALSPRS
jgi:hemerythrin-like domain-containing protein